MLLQHQLYVSHQKFAVDSNIVIDRYAISLTTTKLSPPVFRGFEFNYCL
jgi:hypothetical protein